MSGCAMERLFPRYREPIAYLFWGGMTTLVNFAVYFLCTGPLQIHDLAGNVLAWAAAVAFAFVVNKLWVFRSKSWARGRVFRELGQFVSARLLSGAMETGILWLFVDLLRFDDGPVKIAASVLVVLFNYIISKWIIFKRA